MVCAIHMLVERTAFCERVQWCGDNARAHDLHCASTFH